MDIIRGGIIVLVLITSLTTTLKSQTLTTPANDIYTVYVETPINDPILSAKGYARNATLVAVTYDERGEDGRIYLVTVLKPKDFARSTVKVVGIITGQTDTVSVIRVINRETGLTLIGGPSRKPPSEGPTLLERAPSTLDWVEVAWVQPPTQLAPRRSFAYVFDVKKSGRFAVATKIGGYSYMGCPVYANGYLIGVVVGKNEEGSGIMCQAISRQMLGDE